MVGSNHIVTFLSWNLNGKSLGTEITAFAQEHQVDMLVLSEFAGSPVSLLESLNAGNRPKFHFAPGLCERIRIFTRFSSQFLAPTHESVWLSIRHLALPARLENRNDLTLK